jgi:hypothetical protein
VALTRAIQHTYILSPVDMAGLVGMAQTLAVFHAGYYTLRHGGLTTHSYPRTDSIAMLTTVNGVRLLRRYRLVVAQRSKLRLAPPVATTLASNITDHRLTASGFFPCSIDREYLYGYAADGYRSPLWICASHDGCAVLVHRMRSAKVYFHKAIHEKRLRAIRGVFR